MGEKQENKNQIITKERIIPAVIGLVIGIILTCLVGFFMDYFAKSTGIAKLKYGDEAIASIAGKSISTETIYNRAKLSNGLNYLINEVDKIIFNDMYQLTEKEIEQAKEQADYYIQSYESMGYTQEIFFSNYGFADYDDFLEDIKLTLLTNKYIYNFLEGKLEEGAVEKYYNENKDNR